MSSGDEASLLFLWELGLGPAAAEGGQKPGSVTGEPGSGCWFSGAGNPGPGPGGWLVRSETRGRGQIAGSAEPETRGQDHYPMDRAGVKSLGPGTQSPSWQ